jgi:hypothetical protein
MHFKPRIPQSEINYIHTQHTNFRGDRFLAVVIKIVSYSSLRSDRIGTSSGKLAACLGLPRQDKWVVNHTIFAKINLLKK